MLIHTQKETLVHALSSAAKNDKIGFVPTMGALHKGHISLVNKALAENDLVVVSIFVNPTQFNNSADLQKYPRTPEDDISLLKRLKGDLIVYLPEVSGLYEDSIFAKKYNFGGLENEMEGKHRSGHFDGVGTIVNKLFRIVKPDAAYFGEKDFQQLQIVKKLVAIENLPVKIIGCAILREDNGLAMSSRNKRLSAKQIEEATIIYRTLNEVREKFSSTSIADLNTLVAERFLQNPHLELEYFEIANEKTLKTAKRKNEDLKYRAFIAVLADEVRLIDNMPLN
ncbi:pantoate--beta-alanine ligase [Aequorivita lipolytica]|uniref:Pantothenate synthetase n=1 Tax=Aequorivita lipolytica TaxID=153267 RepID=A0A5C6YQV4_9FLAO|nr:pantoate--beta-alanine ligase [Aequorivita lipolytica]TXD69353.1 pantoate--beta-alanine ligase [Aequorivita lipolytica]SRX53704.1 Pantothenate synthetase [Aequorivita lipolytica]